MGTRENKVEVYLHANIKVRGGNTWKTIGTVGMPDRLCCVPDFGMFTVEIKTHDGVLSTPQARFNEKIIKSGGRAFVAYGTSGVDELMAVIDA